VAAGSSGLQIINVTVPGAPAPAGWSSVPGGAMAVAVDGDYACVAAGEPGVQLLSISDPLLPTLLGSCGMPGTASGIILTGDYAYVAEEPSFLRVIRIDDTTSPLTVGVCDVGMTLGGFTLAGDHAFVVGSGGIQAINIAEPVLPPVSVGTYDTPDLARGVTVAGDYLYVGDRESGLQVLDISDPENPTLAGSCATPGKAWKAAVAGDYAFLAADHSGLHAVDISDPTNPTIVGSCVTPGTAWDCVAAGDYVYVADRFSLEVIDVSDPGSPTPAGTCASPGGDIHGVAIAGDYAYVNESPRHLDVIDISNPEEPTLVGRCESSYPTLYGVAVAGDYVFLCTTGPIEVFDVQDPTNPSIVGECDMLDTPREILVSGDYAFVACTTGGLYVLDITDPTSPEIIGTCDTPDLARGIAVAGDYAFVGDYDSGVQVFRIFERFDHESDTGQSLAVDASDEPVVRLQFSTSQADSITWELTLDGGTSWGEYAPDSLWLVPPSTGDDIMWRSTHTYVERAVNPACTDLTLDWLYRFAIIDSVVDVPGDQGSHVRLHLTRSGYDFVEEEGTPIWTYNVLRRVDDGTAARIRQMTDGRRWSTQSNAAGGLPEMEWDDRRFVVGRAGAGRGELPAGTWEILGSFAALQQQEYIYVAETVADSTEAAFAYSVFCVTAHTTQPSVWHCSEPDSGYSVDNIAPGVPTGFAVSYTVADGNELSWEPCGDEDFQYFRVHRGDSEDFEPSPGNLVHVTVATNWLDSDGTCWHHYKLTALDHAGNASGPASPEEITGAEEAAMPTAPALYQCIPNPVAGAAEIRYDIPAGAGRVKLSIYDVTGRLVRTLVDGVATPGRNELRWERTDESGRPVASGVYFCRLEVDGQSMTRKLLLMK